MSILIKNKALPKTCEECLFYGIDVESGCFLEKCFVIRRADQDKPSWCPLVPVPPHGRLIDADALRQTMYHEAFETDSPMQKWDSGCWIRYKMFERMEEAAPTIVEAEEEQE